MRKTIYLILACLFISAKINSQVQEHLTIGKVNILYWPYKNKLAKDNETVPAVYSVTITTNTVNNPPNVSVNKTSAIITNTVNKSPSQNMPSAVISEAIIMLKNSGTVKKVYLKIYEKDSKTSFYEANYSIATQSETKNNAGIKIYSKNGNELRISNPSLVFLKPYKYEIITEDKNGIKSPVFLVTW